MASDTNLEEILSQKPTLDELIQSVKTFKWFELGSRLGLTSSELENIRDDDKEQALFELWLRKPNCRRQELVLSLQEVGECDVAEKYLQHLKDVSKGNAAGQGMYELRVFHLQ